VKRVEWEETLIGPPLLQNDSGGKRRNTEKLMMNGGALNSKISRNNTNLFMEIIVNQKTSRNRLGGSVGNDRKELAHGNMEKESKGKRKTRDDTGRTPPMGARKQREKSTPNDGKAVDTASET